MTNPQVDRRVVEGRTQSPQQRAAEDDGAGGEAGRIGHTLGIGRFGPSVNT
jgi:hypothetical protein